MWFFKGIFNTVTVKLVITGFRFYIFCPESIDFRHYESTLRDLLYI